jgi:hypothetical protein
MKKKIKHDQTKYMLVNECPYILESMHSNHSIAMQVVLPCSYQS